MVRLDAVEEAGAERSVRAAWEFREREDVLLEREAARVLVRRREEEARRIVERGREEWRSRDDFQVRGREFRVFAGL